MVQLSSITVCPSTPLMAPSHAPAPLMAPGLGAHHVACVCVNVIVILICYQILCLYISYIIIYYHVHNFFFF